MFFFWRPENSQMSSQPFPHFTLEHITANLISLSGRTSFMPNISTLTPVFSIFSFFFSHLTSVDYLPASLCIPNILLSHTNPPSLYPWIFSEVFPFYSRLVAPYSTSFVQYIHYLSSNFTSKLLNPSRRSDILICPFWSHPLKIWASSTLSPLAWPPVNNVVIESIMTIIIRHNQ